MNENVAKKTKDIIAWQGWEMPILPEWRPLQMEGGRDKGNMMIGDSEGPIVQFKWMRPPAKKFSWTKWRDRRFRMLKCLPSDGTPAPKDFDEVAWVHELEFSEGDNKTMWYGYSRKADLLLEIVTTSMVRKGARRMLERKFIPALRTYGSGKECRWVLFKVEFVSPEGYSYLAHQLFSGDISMEFAKGRTDCLTMRQVYPAELALQRRCLAKWLERTPYRGRRKYMLKSEEEIDLGDPRYVPALLRKGSWRIAFPFGPVAPRHSLGLVVKDRTLDRLLCVESISRKEPDRKLLADCIKKMNATIF